MTGYGIGLIAVALLGLPATAQLNALKTDEIKRLVVGSTIGSDPVRSSLETFYRDGRYRHLYQHGVEEGTYSIARSEVCTFTPREVCRRIVRNRKGELFYVSVGDSLNRPWPLKIVAKN